MMLLVNRQIPKSKMFGPLFQLMVVALLFKGSFRGANASALPEPEATGTLNDIDAPNMEMSMAEKRNWKNLRGAWGKRTWTEEDLASNQRDSNEIDEVLYPEHWLPFLMATVDRPSPIVGDNEDLMSAVNKALDIDTNANLDDELFAGKAKNTNNLNSNIGGSNKRSWKSMSVAWGKRRNAPTWNKFRGAWGKRVPGWNNLKGAWGKRAAKDWQKLYSGWAQNSLN